jgi:hypothetical protein
MERLSGRSLAARLFGASPERTLALLRAVWPLAVGPELARRAEPVGVDRGTLRVRVPDAAWRRTVHRMQPQILARLRELAGELAPYRMGFLESRAADGRPDASESGVERDAVAVDAGGFQGGSPLPPGSQWRSPPEIEDVAAAIPDPEIRARFAATAARYLDRSKGRTDA